MPELSLKELARVSLIRRRKGKDIYPESVGKAEAVKIGRSQIITGLYSKLRSLVLLWRQWVITERF